MSNVVLNIRLEGPTLDAALATLGSSVDRAKNEYLRTQEKSFYFNVYDSDDHAFAIGKRAHASSYVAASRASGYDGFAGTFELKFNPSTGKVVSNGRSAAPDTRYFIVSNEGGTPKFSRGYPTRAKAEANTIGGQVVAVSRSGRAVWAAV